MCLPNFEETVAVVLDTNVFVAAGFKRQSAAAKIVVAIRRGSLRLVWNRQTRRETRRILQRIPPLSWDEFAELFRVEDEHCEDIDPAAFACIPDPEDRKYAALSKASGAILLTNDSHLLDHRGQAGIEALTPASFRKKYL